MINVPPQYTRDPKLYAMWLKSQGVPTMQVVSMLEQQFGAPKTQNDINKEKASQDQKTQFAKIAGGVAGAYAGSKIPGMIDYAKDKIFTDAPKPTTSGGVSYEAMAEIPAPKPVGISRMGAAPEPQLPSAEGTPKVLASKGDISTVETPVGPQDVPTESLNEPGFWSTVDWGKMAQGGLSALQLYQGYKSFKGGDKVGGTIGMAGGAANLAASGALGSSAATGATNAMGGYLVPGLNVAAGLYGGYKTAEMIGSAASGGRRNRNAALGGAGAGAAIGTAIVPGIGTAIGAAVGALAGAIGSWTGSSKGKAQTARDSMRNVMQEGGILDKDYMGTLADGSKYDFGKDGSTLKWKNVSKVAEANPEAWKGAVPLTDALATAYGFVGQKASDISAWYAKGAISNANNDPEVAKANARHFAKQQGITMDLIKNNLDSALKDNRIDQTQYNYYMSGAQDLVGGSATQEQNPNALIRPKKGETLRVSPGMYRNDQGKLIAASSTGEALRKFYKPEKK